MKVPEDALQILFLEALAVNEDQRDTWCIERCGDDKALLAAIQRLLAADRCDDNPLEAGVDQLIPSTFGLPSEDSTDPIQSPEEHHPRLLGRYELRRSLGKGGMGAVFLAYDSVLKRDVAIKFPRSTPAEEELRQFHLEAQAAAALRHPNICPVFDVGEAEGRHYISMAYVPGRTLDAFINPQRPQPPRNVALVIRKLARGLHAAHMQGVVHRDVKPSNIMIDEQNEPIVMDFGLAQHFSVLRDGDQAKIVGTPAYMSPEQARGDIKAVGAASDIFSLGVVFYELLTGRRPFAGKQVGDILEAIQQKAEVPIRKRRPDVDVKLATICQRMMAKSIEDRYQSMEAVANDLKAALKTTNHRSKQLLWTAALTATIVAATAIWLMIPRVGKLELTAPDEVAITIDNIPTVNRSAPVTLPNGEHEVTAIYPDGTLWATTAIVGPWSIQKIKVPQTPEEAIPTLHGTTQPNPDSTHELQVNQKPMTAALSPDGTLIAMAISGEAIEVHDIVGRSRVATFDMDIDGSTDARPQLRFLSQRQLLATDSVNGVHLYSLAPPRWLRSYEGLFEPARCIVAAVDLDRVAAADPSGNLLVWRLTDGSVTHRISLSDPVVAMCRVPKSPYFAISHGSGLLQLLDINTLDLESPRWIIRSFPAKSMAATPDGETLAVTFGDDDDESLTKEAICFFGTNGGHEISRIAAHQDAADLISFDATGKYLLSHAAVEKSIRMWDWRAGREVDRVTDEADALAAIDEDGLMAAFVRTTPSTTGETTGTGVVEVRLTQMDNHEGAAKNRTPVRDGPPGLLVAHPDRLTHHDYSCDVAWLPDGRRFVTAHNEMCRVWDVQGTIPLWEFPMPAVNIESSHHSRVASFHDLQKLSTRYVRAIAVSPRGDVVATGEHYKLRVGAIRRWRIDPRWGDSLIPGPLATRQAVYAVTFSPDGEKLAVATTDSSTATAEIRQWHSRMTTNELVGKPLRLKLDPYELQQGHVMQDVAYFDNETLIAVHCASHDIRCWNSLTGKTHWTLAVEGWPSSISISPSRRMLAVGLKIEREGALKHLIHVYGLPELKLINQIAAHKGLITQVKFTPDGTRLVTASAGRYDKKRANWVNLAGKQIFCWDVETWQQVGPVLHPGTSILGMAISPDSRFAVTSQGGITKVWRLPRMP